MWIGYREQTPPEVFSAAAILISAPKKLVSMAEIIMPAPEIGLSVAEIIISTMQITASLISIMMCGLDMIVSVAEITVSLVANDRWRLFDTYFRDGDKYLREAGPQLVDSWTPLACRK